MKLLQALQSGSRVHYEPLGGGLIVLKGGGAQDGGSCEEVNVTEFEGYNLLADFMDLKSADKIEWVDRIGKGCHRVFRGATDVYALKQG